MLSNKAMKHVNGMRRPGRNAAAFTRLELVVVVAVCFVLLSMIVPASTGRKAKATRISCVNNLKQIGTASRIWENDHGYTLPTPWNEYLARTNAGNYCWAYYSILSNNLGQIPKILICPADERQPATSFEVLKDNSHLSYFVGVGANDSTPQSILGGDRNLGPGMVSGSDYGYSPDNGMGNDVDIQTNSSSGPVSWSLKMHSAGSTAGAGNILLGDGSAQQVTSAGFRQNWQPSAGVTTNWPAGHVPSSPSFRVIFP
jgi:type II secretory pathway pseudopilin PulG